MEDTYPDAYPLVYEENGFGRSFRCVPAGNHLYVADWVGLKVFNVADPTQPALVGSLNTAGTCYDVAVQGELAFLADYHEGLVVVDISNPVDPRLLATLSLPGLSWGLDVAGDLVYVAAHFGGTLHVVDVSDPATPFLAGQASSNIAAMDVVVQGDKAYVVAAIGAMGLVVCDLTDPTTPVLQGNVPLPGLPYGLSVAGDVVAVAWAEDPPYQFTGGAVICDVSDPLAPSEVASIESGYMSYGVAIDGPWLYLCSGGVRIYDISNPGAPQPVSELGSPGVAYGAAVAGSTAFICNGEGLTIHDVSDVESPLLLGSYEAPLPLRSLAAQGDLVALSRGETEFYTLADPSAPQLLSSLPFYARDIAMSDGFAFVVSTDLMVADLEDPTAPLIIAERPISSIYAAGLDPAGDRLCLGGYQEVELFDVSDPGDPIAQGGWNPQDPVFSVAWSGDLVLTGHVTGMDIHDVTDPDNPQLVGTHYSSQRIVGLATRDSLVYVLEANANFWMGGVLRAIDISDPTTPSVRSSMSLTELTSYMDAAPTDIVLHGSFAYVSADLGGAVVVDITDPDQLEMVGQVETAGSAYRIAVTGDYALIGDRYAGLNVSWLQCEEGSAAPDDPLPAAGAHLQTPYPNPFNPVVRLPFVLDQEQRVQLSVYDAAGHRVAVLVDERLGAGQHEASWFGHDQLGRDVPSGVYSLRLDAGGRVDTRSMVLLR